MAEYIKKEDLKFLEIPIAPVIQGEQVHYEQGFLKEWLESVPTADVIKRSEYDKLLEENKQLKRIISDKVNEDLKCAFEVKELRSKIDKAKKQITDSMNEHLASDGTPVDEYAYCYLNVLEILEENIGE